MARLLVFLPFLVLALDIFGVVDVILTPEWRIRALNKVAWVFIVLLLPIVGVALWLTLGKARANDPGFPARRPTAPDDDPAFLRRMTRADEQEARIRQLEAELKALDDDQNKE